MSRLLASPWTPPVALAVLVAAAYATAVSTDWFFDDFTAIVENPQVVDWNDRPQVGLERPVATWTFYANYHVAHAVARLTGRSDPEAVAGAAWHYKLVNVVIHWATAWLACLLLRRLLGRMAAPIAERARTLALVAAAIWAVHPITTQAVTYTVQRMESLMALWYLAVLLAVVEARRDSRSDDARWWRDRRLLALATAAIVGTVLAILTKPVAVTLPIAAIWLDRVMAPSWTATARRWPLFVLMLAALLANQHYFGAALRKMKRQQSERTQVEQGGVEQGGVERVEAAAAPGAAAAELHRPLPRDRYLQMPSSWEYLRTQPEVLLHYGRLVLLPTGLVIDDDWPVQDNPLVYLPLGLLVVGWIVGVGWLMPRRPVWAVLLGMPLLVLGPTSSVIPIRDLAFEHRMYLPSLFLVAAIVIGLWHLLARRGRLAIAAPLVGLTLLALAATTSARNRDYRSDVAMWTDVVEKRPQNARAWFNLGDALRKRRDYDDPAEIAALFQKAASLERVPGRRAFILNGLSRTLLFLGELDAADAAAREATDLLDRFAGAPFVRAEVARRRGDAETALRFYDIAQRRDPSVVAIYTGRGQLHMAAGRPEQALDDFTTGLLFDPENKSLLNNRAVALETLGRYGEAADAFNALLVATPDDAQALLSRARMELAAGRYEQASADFQTIVRLAPQTAIAWQGLIAAEEALGHDETAERLRAEAARRGLLQE